MTPAILFMSREFFFRHGEKKTNEAALAPGMVGLIFEASVISIRAAVSVAIVQLAAGVIGGNFSGLHTIEWIDFLAGIVGHRR